MPCCHVEGTVQGCAHEGSTVPTWAPYQSQGAMGAISESHKEQGSGDIWGGVLRRYPGWWGRREASRNCVGESFTLSPWKPSHAAQAEMGVGDGVVILFEVNSIKRMKLGLLFWFECWWHESSEDESGGQDWNTELLPSNIWAGLLWSDCDVLPHS